MSKATKPFYGQYLKKDITGAKRRRFRRGLFVTDNDHVSRDLIRSAYLRDSCGAAKVNTGIIGISYLHNAVCRLKAVRDTASSAFKLAFTPLQDEQEFFKQNLNLGPHLNMTSGLIGRKTSPTGRTWTHVSFQCTLSNKHTRDIQVSSKRSIWMPLRAMAAIHFIS